MYKRQLGIDAADAGLAIGEAFDQSSTKRRAKSEAEGTQPVSYTHLRAHETVLDLVCRLLLEKKKETKKTQPLCRIT